MCAQRTFRQIGQKKPEGLSTKSKLLANSRSKHQEVQKKPLSKYSFYLDLNDAKIAKTVGSDIVALGGVVEAFLSKDVHYLVTNRPKKAKQSGNESPTPFSSTNSFSTGRSTPTHSSVNLDTSVDKARPVKSRTDALLEMARHCSTKGSSDVLQNAQLWGVKVIHITTFLSRLKELKAKNVTKSEAAAQTSRKGHVIKLVNPFIKFEDEQRKFCPQYKQLTSWPVLNLSRKLGRSSPFVWASESRSKDAKRSTDTKIPKPKMVASVSEPNKPGFCEICDIRYNDVYKHAESEKHEKNLENPSFYSRVDAKIESLQTLSALVEKYTSDESKVDTPSASKTCAAAVTPFCASFKTPTASLKHNDRKFGDSSRSLKDTVSARWNEWAGDGDENSVKHLVSGTRSLITPNKSPKRTVFKSLDMNVLAPNKGRRRDEAELCSSFKVLRSTARRRNVPPKCLFQETVSSPVQLSMFTSPAFDTRKTKSSPSATKSRRSLELTFANDATEQEASDQVPVTVPLHSIYEPLDLRVCKQESAAANDLERAVVRRRRPRESEEEMITAKRTAPIDPLCYIPDLVEQRKQIACENVTAESTLNPLCPEDFSQNTESTKPCEGEEKHSLPRLIFKRNDSHDFISRWTLCMVHR